MGVSGCGKSTVGEAVAVRCDLTFVDGDDLHPDTNIAKMARGVPLDDTDRGPWLQTVGRTLENHDGPILIGCSALKRSYRDLIRAQVRGAVHFVHLDAPKNVLLERVNDRSGHFMPPELLDSQFDALERLERNENGVEIDIAKPFADVVDATESYVRKNML